MSFQKSTSASGRVQDQTFQEDAAGSAVLLEQEDKVVERAGGATAKPGLEVRRWFEVRPCTCGSPICASCRAGWALKWRERFRRLHLQEGWGFPCMISLTYDPNLFSGPGQAWRYLKMKRAVSEFVVKGLRREGFIGKVGWYCMMEFQKSGRVHFHLVVPLASWAKLADPQDLRKRLWRAVYDCWSRLRPNTAGPDPLEGAIPRKGERPAFGTVDVKLCDFEKFGDEAPALFAKYVTKYAVEDKNPVPDWYVDALGTGNPSFVSHARGLFPYEKPRTEKVSHGPELHDDLKPHDPTCFCEFCREGLQPPKPGRASRTARERVEACGKMAELWVYEREEWIGGKGEARRTFVGELDTTWEAAKEAVALGDEKARVVARSECAWLLEHLGMTEGLIVAWRDVFGEPPAFAESLPIGECGRDAEAWARGRDFVNSWTVQQSEAPSADDRARVLHGEAPARKAG